MNRADNLLRREDLNQERAEQVRAWRVDGEYSWRAVAWAAARAWGLAHGGNQYMGQQLCHAAAVLLGQDPDGPQWHWY